MNVVTGNDAGNALSGTAGGDLIYGFDPNAAYASATIAATRVASGLDQPLYVTAAPGDTNRLFIVEKTGTIKLRPEQRAGAGDAISYRAGQHRERTRPARSRLRSGLRHQRRLLRLCDVDRRVAAQRGVALSRLGQSQCRGGGPRPHPRRRPLDQRQPQCRLARASGRTASLHRIGRGRRPGERAGHHQPARQDPAHRRRSGRARLSDSGRQSVRRRRRRRTRRDLGATACAIRGARASIPRPATSSSAMSAGPRSRKSISARRARTTVGRTSKALPTIRASSIRSLPIRTAAAPRSPAAMSIAARAMD